MRDDSNAGGAEDRTAGGGRPRRLRADTVAVLEHFEALDGERLQGGNGWYAPADFHQTGIRPAVIALRLRTLAAGGLLERRDRDPDATARVTRRWEYRITNAGALRLAFERPS